MGQGWSVIIVKMFREISCIVIHWVASSSCLKKWEPAKKLSRRLLGLGAQEICSRGEGNDQYQLGMSLYAYRTPGTESLLGWMVPWTVDRTANTRDITSFMPIGSETRETRLTTKGVGIRRTDHTLWCRPGILWRNSVMQPLHHSWRLVSRRPPLPAGFGLWHQVSSGMYSKLALWK